MKVPIAFSASIIFDKFQIKIYPNLYLIDERIRHFWRKIFGIICMEEIIYYAWDCVLTLHVDLNTKEITHVFMYNEECYNYSMAIDDFDWVNYVRYFMSLKVHHVGNCIAHTFHPRLETYCHMKKNFMCVLRCLKLKKPSNMKLVLITRRDYTMLGDINYRTEGHNTSPRDISMHTQVHIGSAIDTYIRFYLKLPREKNPSEGSLYARTLEYDDKLKEEKFGKI